MEKNGPRWIVLSVDLAIVFVAFLVSYILVLQHGDVILLGDLFIQTTIVTVIYAGSFVYYKSFSSIVRQTGMAELYCIGNAVASALVVLLISSFLYNRYHFTTDEGTMLMAFSQSQLFIHALVVGAGMATLRLLYKNIYRYFFWHNRQNAIPVVLFGAGDMGHSTFDLLQLGSRNRYKIVAIIDDNPSRIGKSMQGFRILALSELTLDLINRVGVVQQLVIAIDDHQPARLQRIAAQAEGLPMKLKIIPKSTKLMEDMVATKQIRTLKIDDLLGRKSIEINNPLVNEEMKGKVIIVTGGAGSIGGELVRQIARTECAKLVVIDQAESALYDIQQELLSLNSICPIICIVGNVRDYGFIETIFAQYRPHIVFHAAAYKHVPLMEENPYEAVLTNVCGSSNVALLADRFGAQKFVMISTDKAVNPTNVMGATKRISEIYVSSLNAISKTAYIVTRFGNVLGSNGSVIPLFEKQIKQGGPLTITHPDITRYFMTIPEACKLVQEAGVMGNGGEVFVFDMGKPVRIVDLAIKMIRLKGLKYPEDVDIQYVGLRPGEKTFEELLATDENTVKTYNEKIMIAKVATGDPASNMVAIDELSDFAKKNCQVSDKRRIVAMVKCIVPEYKSQNSIYTELDGLEPVV